MSMLTMRADAFILGTTSNKVQDVTDEEFLNVEYVAEYLNVDPWTVREWLKEGRFNWKRGNKTIGAFKTGPSHSHPWRIPHWALDRFIEDRQKERGQA